MPGWCLLQRFGLYKKHPQARSHVSTCWCVMCQDFLQRESQALRVSTQISESIQRLSTQFWGVVLFSRKTWIQAPGMFPPATCGTMPGRAIRKWDMSFRPVLMLRALWYTDILKNTVCNHRHLEPEPQNGKTAGLSTRLEFSFYIRPLGDRDPYELLFSGISGWRVFSMDVYPCAN